MNYPALINNHASNKIGQKNEIENDLICEQKKTFQKTKDKRKKAQTQRVQNVILLKLYEN